MLKELTVAPPGPTGENLFASFDKFVVTVEPVPDPDPGPSKDIALIHTIPAGGITHIRHLLFSWWGNPPYDAGFYATKEGSYSVATGEVTTAPSIKVYDLKGGTREIKSFSLKSADLPPCDKTEGNRITFDTLATKDKDGKVQGKMKLTDQTCNITIESDVVDLAFHSAVGAPVGFTGRSLTLRSSTTSVVVNGKAMPGWRFVNSPTYDSGKAGGADDGVCFELFRPKLPDEPQPPGDPAGLVRVLQWAGFLSNGNIEAKIGTPKGIAVGLREQAWLAFVHARLAVQSKKLSDVQLHAEHVVNIIEGVGGPNYGDLDKNGTADNPGDGFGVLNYARAAWAAASLA